MACRPWYEHLALGHRMMASRSQVQASGAEFLGCVAIHTIGGGKATLGGGFGGSAIRGTRSQQ